MVGFFDSLRVDNSPTPARSLEFPLNGEHDVYAYTYCEEGQEGGDESVCEGDGEHDSSVCVAS